MLNPKAVILAFSLLILQTQAGFCHCDTMDGPVVRDAKSALEKKDVTPVLKWVRSGDEAQIRSAFSEASAAREQGEESRAVADKYFFETLVRIHRAGEGEPYTGLLPEGAETEPGIAEADAAIESGSVEAVLDAVHRRSRAGIEERFRRLIETGKHKDESVESGRAYVAAYVDFIHYVAGLYESSGKTEGKAHHGHE